MPCETCDHTLHTVIAEERLTVRWCPRCGTLQTVVYGHENTSAPKVVECLRSFARSVSLGQDGRYLRTLMHESGVSESILTPDKRPEAT